MSRILAYTSPALGHLYPTTPILDELRRRGHEISLRRVEVAGAGTRLAANRLNPERLSQKVAKR